MATSMNEAIRQPAENSSTRTFRIAFTGAQGTGKSTLARALLAALEARATGDVEGFFGAGARTAAAGLNVGERAGADAVRHFVHLHLEREADATRRVQVFDRCLLDALAYAHVLGCLDTRELAALSEAARVSCSAMKDLFWMRITSDYPVLTAEDESPAFRRAIDAAIGRYAAGLSIRVEPLALDPADVTSAAETLALRYAVALQPG